jgi:CRISPR/Cas system-associated protein Cas7 (RAMP superfamily)
MRSRHLPSLLLALVPLLGGAAGAGAETAKPALSIEAVKVEPASPRPDTLCRLTVTLKNAGEQRASALEMTVKINGRELPAYGKRLYLTAVEPGATREVRLLNFWSTETGRPAPADGKLNVEVTLSRASWMRKAARDGAEVWTPMGDVPGLPVTRSVTLTMAK